MNQLYRWSPSLEVAELDGEWIVMNAEGMTMTRLNELGGYIWSQFKSSTSVEPVINKVIAEYDVDKERAQQDVEAFVGALCKAGLLEDAHAS